MLLKGASSKARAVTYQNLHLQAGVGLTSKYSWLINMNSWLKPREKETAKVEMTCPAFQGPRSQTNRQWHQEHALGNRVHHLDE
ncbi:MAG: hypothetical protein ACTSUE_17415 [Promethearchaeota archaeon]